MFMAIEIISIEKNMILLLLLLLAILPENIL